VSNYYPPYFEAKCRSWILSVGEMLVAINHKILQTANTAAIRTSAVMMAIADKKIRWMRINVETSASMTMIGGNICVSGGVLVNPL